MKFSHVVILWLVGLVCLPLNGQDVALEDGLRLHVNFNANLTDQSANVNDGILRDSFYAMDRFGNCAFAMGFDDYLQLTAMDIEAVAGLQDFSISLWIKKDVTSFTTLLSVANTQRDNELNLNIDSGGRFTSNIRNLPNVPGIAIVGNTSVHDEMWHHVVMTREGSSGDTYIYIDKLEDAYKRMPLGEIEVSTSAFVLGNDQDCVNGCYDVGQQFKGQLDDLRIYDRVITQDEINALFEFEDGETDDKVRGSYQELTFCNEVVFLEIERDFDSFQWSTGSTNRSIEVTENGLYIVSGLVHDCEYKDSVNVEINTLPDLSIEANGTDLACFGNIVIEASPGFDEYVWQDGSSGATYEVVQPGFYSVRGISSCGEVESNEVEIQQSPMPVLSVNTESESVFCGETLLLSADDGFTDYRWSDGQTGRVIEVRSPGTYEVSATDICGDIQRATMMIESGDDKPFFVPNTFTPNGDGKNESFEIDSRLLGFSVKIIDRWGKRVYSSNSYGNDWNGNELSNGVYYYLINGPCLDQPLKGWVKIIR